MNELTKAMDLLAEEENVVFLGQGVGAPGTFMSRTLDNVHPLKKIELPVAEEMQMGMSIGMALHGQIPVSIYPRWNFLLCAANQLVNHLAVMKPHVIVRVGVGSSTPLDPGPQHVGDFTNEFRMMMPGVRVKMIYDASLAVPRYKEALEHKGPTILVELADKY